MGLLDGRQTRTRGAGQLSRTSGGGTGSVPPGPQPGYQSPAGNRSQPVTNNGRPRERAAGPGQAGQSAFGGGEEESLQSPGAVEPPPPVPPAVGFTIPWQGMNDPTIPQPVAELGKMSYNPLTGEWFMG